MKVVFRAFFIFFSIVEGENRLGFFPSLSSFFPSLSLHFPLKRCNMEIVKEKEERETRKRKKKKEEEEEEERKKRGNK